MPLAVKHRCHRMMCGLLVLARSSRGPRRRERVYVVWVPKLFGLRFARPKSFVTQTTYTPTQKLKYTKRTRIGHTDPNLGANGVEGLRVGSDPCARWPCGLWTGMHQKHTRAWLGRERARLVCGEEHVAQLFSKSEFQKIFRIFFHSFLWVFCVWFTLFSRMYVFETCD